MNKVIALNIIAVGTLEEIHSFLRKDRSNSSEYCLVVPEYSRQALGNAADFRTDSVQEVAYGIYPISSNYFNYGFDIVDGSGSAVELQALDEGEFYLVDGIAGRPREPEPESAEKVSVINTPPDITALSSDELFTVVASYDEIHSAAKEELNKRISAIKTKLV